MNKRLMAFSLALAVTFSGLCARILMIGQSVAFTAGDQWSSRLQTVAVSRGTIYDRYYAPLVNATSQWKMAIAPHISDVRVVKELTSDRFTNTQSGGFIITDGAYSITPTDGLWQFEVPCRYSAPTACHIVGYINGAGEGVSGIERVCDEILKSYSGQATISYQANALGQISLVSEPIVNNTLDRCKGGVVLTLDAQLQRIAERAENHMERGAVVVLSAKNAEILASASFPQYDPADVSTVLEESSSPLLDRTCINYNLGSVFKVLVAAAALENGFDISKTYECNGAVEVNGTVFHCHNRLGDGVQNMSQAMANSCNCYFIQLALDIGAKPIMDMARLAGFDKTVSLMSGFDTSRGLLPDASNLKAQAALANLSIGQGELAATPYHVAALYKAVADDGLWQMPSLYIGNVDENGELFSNVTTPKDVRLFSKQTASLLKSMLETVVQEGTGREAAPCYATAAGKTGTAQTGWIQNGEAVTQSWFAGYYPAENPQYVIAVLSENGGNNGQTAAPIFAYLCDEMFAAGLVEKAK